MNIILLMAGEGKRFKDAGYEKTKPLIEISYKGDKIPLYMAVIDNVFDIFNSAINSLTIIKKENVEVDLIAIKKKYNIDVNSHDVKETTEGALCTALLARKYILDSGDPILISNCDQLIEINQRNFNTFSYNVASSGNFMFTFETKDDSTKWSFAKTNYDETINEVREKEKISNLATCGIYHFTSFSIFEHDAKEMIKENDRFNNEFYLAPIYNYLRNFSDVFHFQVDKFCGLGTPEDLEKYEAEILNKHAIMGM